MEPISHNVRYFRKLRGMTQAELAKAAGTTQYTVSEIELAHREPHPATLRKLAAALGVRVADFYGESDSPLGAAPSSQEKLFNNGLEEERRTPTPFERHAVEALEDRCSHLEAVLKTAQRRSIPLEIWKLESDYALDIAMLSLPLFEREHLRPLVRPVGARFTELVYAMLDGMKDAGSIEEAERRRAAFRPLEEAVA